MNDMKPVEVTRTGNTYRIHTRNPFSVRAGAFGSGEHETTAACLGIIDALAAPGMRVLDVGTGTGILAIAAVRAGASFALAYDIEPAACRVTAANIRDTGTANVHVVCSDGAAVRGVYDMVVANIYADVLSALVPCMTEWVAPGGITLLSGIPVEENYDIRRRYRAAGFIETANMLHEEFSTVLLRRSSADASSPTDLPT